MASQWPVTLLFLQLLEIWWSRIFNASLEHSMPPWTKHSQLAINPDSSCLEVRTGGAKPYATEAPSSRWTVFIISVNHGGFILLLVLVITRSIVPVSGLNFLLIHCAGVIGGVAVDVLLVCFIDRRWGLVLAFLA